MKFSITKLFAVAALATATTLAGTTFADDDAKEQKLTKAKPVAKAVANTKVRPLSVNVDLLTDTQIKGTLTSETSTLSLQSSFGTINVPLTEVAGIRFASAENASTTVVMLNGDSITGATDVKVINVETEWGSATINGPTISSILFVPGLTWSSSEGMNGKRWKLASNIQKKNVTPVSNNITTRRVTNQPQPIRNSIPQSQPIFRSR